MSDHPTKQTTGPVNTAALRRFADRYEERTRCDLRAAGLLPEGDVPGPACLIRDAAAELDRLRAELAKARAMECNCIV